MSERTFIIPPCLHLPSKEPFASLHTVKLPRVPRQRRWRKLLIISILEMVYIIAALSIGYLANTFLGPWPVYRFITYIVIGILWSNLASMTTRQAAKKQARQMLNTMSVPIVHMRTALSRRHPQSIPILQSRTTPPYRQRKVRSLSMKGDTETYLIALRRSIERRHSR